MSISPLRRAAALLTLASRLGYLNCFRVLKYRVLKTCGYYRAALPIKKFAPPASLGGGIKTSPISDSRINLEALAKRGAELKDGIFTLYFRHSVRASPKENDWHTDLLNGHTPTDTNRHWSHIRFFPAPGFDIKNVWELGRFYWLTDLARHHRTNPTESLSLSEVNHLLLSWQNANPINQGPHWMCGQETSLRLLNFLLASYITNEWADTAAGIQNFIKNHLTRITATFGYALGQRNNHATSEACALFVGGAALWVLQGRQSHSPSLRYLRIGQRQLEKLVQELLEPEGSFSQRSTNYHRLLLDTLSLAVWASRRFELPPFSQAFLDRYLAAYFWLNRMVDPPSGDAPNLGGNDGSLLFSLTSCDYRDFRPSLQLAAQLLGREPPFPPGPWDEAAAWLSLPERSNQAAPLAKASHAFSNAGYIVIAPSRNSWAMLHAPTFTYRPAHSDLLHLDLWHEGVNILQDSGTFSYNPPLGQEQYRLSAALAHNTISFDNEDQMPLVSRFLYSHWTNCEILTPLSEKNGEWQVAAAYRDYKGRAHTRRVRCKENEWTIEDRIQGIFEQAHLSWHLPLADWRLSGSLVTSPFARIEIKISAPGSEVLLLNSTASRYYQELTTRPCLRCTARGGPATITTSLLLLPKRS
jgi:hypothetical protein